MTYKQIVDKIQSIVENHKMLADFGYGELSDIKVNSSIDSTEADYPYLFLNPATTARTGNVITYGFNLIMMDQVLDNKYLKVQSECMQYLDDVISQLRWGFPDEKFDIVLNFSYTPFKERFQDTVAGATADIQLIVGLPLNYCLAPTSEVTPPTPTCNVDVSFDGWPYTINEGESVQFTNYSSVTPEGCDTITEYNWEFPGGTPATSTDENPLVTYNTAGTYNAKLCITHNNGLTENCWTRPNFITVEALPYTLIFEGINPNAFAGLNDPDLEENRRGPLGLSEFIYNPYNIWRPLNEGANFWTPRNLNKLRVEIEADVFVHFENGEQAPQPYVVQDVANFGVYYAPIEVTGWPANGTIVNAGDTWTTSIVIEYTPANTSPFSVITTQDVAGIPEAWIGTNNLRIRIYEYGA